ncbi:hypothetical protein [Sphingomonas elodea]|uniref:hypothetical protein n=1 Tax=Sphingomonas elodea TaxID=179878 RepID=UPI0002F43EA1|nr:hypothetical protein [Sphingomonas elodea]
MHYDRKPDWKLGAERWMCAAQLHPLGGPEPEDLALFAAIGWLLLTAIHHFLGH